MASVGYVPAAFYFFIGALVSGGTTWILSLAVLEETGMEERVLVLWSWVEVQIVTGLLKCSHQYVRAHKDPPMHPHTYAWYHRWPAPLKWQGPF